MEVPWELFLSLEWPKGGLVRAEIEKKWKSRNGKVRLRLIN